MDVTYRVGESAVVLGAGMAGLLAARVLSEFYASVTIVERDALPDRPGHRKGVPQDRHLHALLGRGVQVLSELLPDVLDEMADAGAVVLRDGDLSQIYARMGHWELARSGTVADPAALTLCLASRPFMEFYVRRQVATLPNVAVLDRHDLLELRAGTEAVTGVHIVNRDNELTTVLDADLVVDATGRAARTPAFVERLGYGRPTEQRAPTAVGYSSQRFAVADDAIGQRLVMANRGARHPSVLLSACEHDTWMLAVGRPLESGGAPADFDEMLALADDVLPGSIGEGLRTARPIGEIATFRNPTSIWRRYDRMERFPGGLLVMGDAQCSLNPIYGQGMTMAALQAITLRDCLHDGRDELARRFFAGSARTIGPVWARNQANERAPAAAGTRSMQARLRSRIVKGALIAAAKDAAVAERLLRVAHLIDPPERVNDPKLLTRIVAANARHHCSRLARRS
ncbi:FAD-dependent oxidoreductase [Mycobacterium sp. 1245111.1]|uniref:FAD-dependent oxidoreductase n=1 Tax=Mycobacterium sp. 1245111.1 TaxID=1834073 RepID=UPI0007FDE9FB|nr:FAD-dependent monooxygenase [Mycobacterium sp. 1245111.1]OBK32357.1 FAD-dependent oxidoreductase [Mycobacterium sp. 1245111.1]